MPSTKPKPKPKQRPTAIVREPGAKYWELVRRHPLLPIESDEQLDAAIEVLNELIDRDQSVGLTKDELDYMNVLGDVVKAFEDAQLPAEAVSDGAMLEFLCDQQRASAPAVARATGIPATTIAAVRQNKRRFTRDQIRRVSEFFQVEPRVFAP